jgi:SAM-dependent methyltransferase
MEDPYSNIANYFDLVAGERYDIEYIRNLVQIHHPRAKSVLEIACGTGLVLENFVQNFEVEGLDISSAMLAKARKRFGPARFMLQDIRNFSTGKCYDVILCVFNSINHLHKFSEWKAVFKSVYKHLNPGGIFVLDIVTIHGLSKFFREPSIMRQEGDSYILIDYSRVSKQMLDMNIKVFTPVAKDGRSKKKFELLEGVIREKSFARLNIQKELERLFMKCKCFDPDRKAVHRFSEVLFFVSHKSR